MIRQIIWAVGLDDGIEYDRRMAELAWLLVCVLLGMLLVGCTVVDAAPSTTTPHDFAVLIFSKTAGYRHLSIQDGIIMIEMLGATHNFSVEASEDAALFNDADLADYDVIIFLNTSGDILDETQQVAFEKFIENGGGFVGIHSATDTEYDWPWYNGLVGAYFNGHPPIQPATVRRESSAHPSTLTLPDEWVRMDEWYNFRDGPSPDITILLTVDEGSYSGGSMGEFHPLAWFHEYSNGRTWYTAMGHTSQSYADADFQAHVLGGIRWAAGMDLSAGYLPVQIKD